jgi:hypothetical protein
MSNNFFDYFIKYNYYLIDNNYDVKDSEIFTLVKLPKISFDKILFDLKNELDLSDDIFLLGLFYLDKIKKKERITEFSIYLITIIIIRLADKYLEDNIAMNDFWAEYLHIDLKNFNYYEYQMIKLLDFNLHINHKYFFKRKNYLISLF